MLLNWKRPNRLSGNIVVFLPKTLKVTSHVACERPLMKFSRLHQNPCKWFLRCWAYKKLLGHIRSNWSSLKPHRHLRLKKRSQGKLKLANLTGQKLAHLELVIRIGKGKDNLTLQEYVLGRKAIMLAQIGATHSIINPAPIYPEWLYH